MRHELQTVAMELAAALHHSRDGGFEAHVGLRTLKTASSGTRPGVLKEPEARGVVVTVGHVAAAVPLGSRPRLQGGYVIDGRAVRFLLK